MSVINTNISATLASNALARNERVMATAMERLSTGQRINSAKDDAAGMAIAARMTGQVRGLEQAARNANDGISMVQTVEGASKEIMNMLVRMRELAVQAASETYSDTDRDALDLEYQALEAEITRVATATQWNGSNRMDLAAASDDFDVQIGANASQNMNVVFLSWDIADAAATAYGVDLSGDDLQSVANATTAITNLDTAINGAAAEQAKYGSYISRLQHASDNLMNVAQNTDASRSRIADADYAKETTELARTQIIAQAGTAMLAQANQVKQTVLALLQ
ncbi:MAG: flagellin [Proteobacteria bacterium]|nr:flagellin [Pseudomonadota bacterium]MDA0928076.1 flagellin [Pseudomonadota bacterium]